MGEQESSLRSSRDGLLLYCIGNASSALPAHGLGVRGGELQCVTHAGLAAVVSPVAELARVETPDTTDLLTYERVIREQQLVADVVPMRFGSVLSGEAAVRAHLEEQRAAYLRTLERVSGCVEMGVRVLVPAPPASAEPEHSAPALVRSGVDYLKARQRRYSAESLLRERCSALEQRLAAQVAPLCREHRMELPAARPGQPTLCSVYFLVPREQVPAVRAALAPLVEAEGSRASLSGPWPPFNFVDQGSEQ